MGEAEEVDTEDFLALLSRSTHWVQHLHYAHGETKALQEEEDKVRVQSGMPPRLPAHDQCMLSHDISACSAT